MNNLLLNCYLRKYFMIDKTQVFNNVAITLLQLGFSIVSIDAARPWGGFYVIAEAQATRFAQHFFPEEDLGQLKITSKLSPKILIVEPKHRLSWQYHHRRAEIWKCVEGPVAVATSDNDEEKEHDI